MTQISKETTFNGNTLLNDANKFKIQAGAGTEVREITTADLSTIAKSLSSTDVGDISKAQSFVGVVDKALEAINKGRSELGAMQNRLEYTSSNLTTSTENLTAPVSSCSSLFAVSKIASPSSLCPPGAS